MSPDSAEKAIEYNGQREKDPADNAIEYMEQHLKGSPYLRTQGIELGSNDISVFIFGSYVTKEKTENSDVDIELGVRGLTKEQLAELKKEFVNDPDYHRAKKNCPYEVSCWFAHMEGFEEPERFEGDLPENDTKMDGYDRIQKYSILHQMGWTGKHKRGKNVVELLRNKVTHVPSEEGYGKCVIAKIEFAEGYFGREKGKKNKLAKAILNSIKGLNLLSDGGPLEPYEKVLENAELVLSGTKAQYTDIVKQAGAIKCPNKVTYEHKDGKQPLDTNDAAFLNDLRSFLGFVSEAAKRYSLEVGFADGEYMKNIHEYVRRRAPGIMKMIRERFEDTAKMTGEEYSTATIEKELDNLMSFAMFYVPELVEAVEKTGGVGEDEDFFRTILSYSSKRTDTESEMLNGKICMLLGKHVEAGKYFSDALKQIESGKVILDLNTEDVHARLCMDMAKALHVQGNTNGATAYAKKSIDINPYAHESWRVLGELADTPQEKQTYSELANALSTGRGALVLKYRDGFEQFFELASKRLKRRVGKEAGNIKVKLDRTSNELKRKLKGSNGSWKFEFTEASLLRNKKRIYTALMDMQKSILGADTKNESAMALEEQYYSFKRQLMHEVSKIDYNLNILAAEHSDLRRGAEQPVLPERAMEQAKWCTDMGFLAIARDQISSLKTDYPEQTKELEAYIAGEKEKRKMHYDKLEGA